MRRSFLVSTVIGSLFVTACGPGQVAITAEIDLPNPEGEGTIVAPLADLVLEFAPFDRDAIFNSLADAFPIPEPQVPADLLEAQAEIADADAAWRASEDTWASARDRQIQITQEMEGLNPAEARYLQLYNEFQDLDGRVGRAEGAKDRAFEMYTGLQEGFILRRDSMRIVKGQWAEEAFESYYVVAEEKTVETGMEMVVDTTDAAGMVQVDLPPGEWWVHARYEEAWSNLYWNEHITVVRGEPQPFVLSRQNAKIRDIF